MFVGEMGQAKAEMTARTMKPRQREEGENATDHNNGELSYLPHALLIIQTLSPTKKLNLVLCTVPRAH